MTRKDEKDTERPHYYSQFWLDVAAGRREIGVSKSDESADIDELPESIAPVHKANRTAPSVLVDGHRNSRPRDLEEEEFAASEQDEQDELEEFSEPEIEESELAGDLEEENTPPDIILGDTIATKEEDAEEEPPTEEGIEDEEYYDEEEDEEEDDWSARGRKKPKPGRQTKAPKPPIKKPKRGGRAF